MNPSRAGQVLAVGEEQHHGEEQDEQHAESYHYPEGIEAHRYEGHGLRLVLQVAVTEVSHVCLQVFAQLVAALGFGCGQAVGPFLGLQFAILFQAQYGCLSLPYLLVYRERRLAVGQRVSAIQQVVDARHESVGVACGQ